MIRVLHVIGCLEMGGSQAMVMNLLRNIDRSKVMFDFIVDHPERNDYEKEVLALGSKIYTMPSFKGYNTGEIRREWNKFFSEHPEYRILHSHVRSYASLYIPIAKKHGLKTVIHSHSTSNGKGIASVVKQILQYPLRYQADYLMACSNESGKWLYGNDVCDKDNYIFVPNAIDTEKFRYSESIASEYRHELDLENKFVIGHVGRFHEAKNHMFLLEAFAKVSAMRSDARLLLIGDGELRSNIENKIHELGIENSVVMTGNRNDVHKLMQTMDVFAFPSLWEGLPVTVVEAQAAGLPCIISDRITTDVDTSELVMRLPVDDSEVWSDAIQKVDLGHTDVIEKIKAAGFDVNDSAAMLTGFYNMIGEFNE